LKPPTIKSKDLLTVTDLSRKEILDIFKFSLKLKKETSQGRVHKLLSGKTLAMIFEKSSTRTRVSFETGVQQLGGNALFLNKNDIQLGRGESVPDTARVLSRYVDGIMIRAFKQEMVTELARHAGIPVINGLTDLYHPCQALSDFFTIYERENNLKRVKISYIGDGNNVAHSLLLCASLLGVDISIASPKGYLPAKNIVERAFLLSKESGATVNITTDIDLATENANYIYTDVWVSMGQEKEAGKRRKALSKYKINSKLLNKCPDNCRVMHCLPAHRGEEIDDDVMDSDKSIIFDQAENRLHLQKGLLCALMGS
jgi:ornithine carbamoyltransferase